MSTNKFLLHELTWEDVSNLETDKTVMIVPVGSVEQHGPQNPLGTDFLIAEYVARKAAEHSPLAYCLPTLAIGVASHHRDFAGTLWISPSTLRTLVNEVILSLDYHGFQKIIVVNGHGGNTAPIMEVIKNCNDEHHMLCLLFEWWTDANLLQSALGISQAIHADAVETSVVWAATTDLVKPEKFDELTAAPKWGVYIGDMYLASRTDQFTSTGIAGSLEGFSRENGQKVLDAAVAKLEKAIQDLSEYQREI